MHQKHKYLEDIMIFAISFSITNLDRYKVPCTYTLPVACFPQPLNFDPAPLPYTFTLDSTIHPITKIKKKRVSRVIHCNIDQN